MRPCVTLIGAGPGDPELLTLKAARVLGAADVVLVDELVNRGCLAHVRAGAKVIEVGKRGGCKSTPQAFIEKLLILYAKEKKNVVRLKGGGGRRGFDLRFGWVFVARSAFIFDDAISGRRVRRAIQAFGIRIVRRAVGNVYRQRSLARRERNYQ